MLKIVSGDLFESNAHAIVNTVNCVGVMGAGIALGYKNRYPMMFADYKKKCAAGYIRVGAVDVYDLNDEYSCSEPGLFENTNVLTEIKTRYIFNFPTKDDWRNPSEIKWIKTGLIHLIYQIGKYDIKSIALPALGCSNGGLNWDEVRKIIVGMLSPISDEVDILIYNPM